MDIHAVRQELKTKTIYDIQLRVTYYARVSSESDEQLNSLENQVNYYEDLIRKNKNWIFVPGYIDEGLSGISTKKRENFNRMIEDAETNKFDIIITKEISRFARNTLDSIQFTRQLLSFGVGVFFQNDNINTLDEDSELRLSIMSSIAQDELRKLSSRIRFGHQQAIKSKVVLGNSRIFGYEKENKRLVINEQEADMVRELFDLYSTGKYSLKQIEKIFWEKGYRNLNGNKIAHTTMSNIISNPKYKGYYVGNKVKITDMFTKKQKFLPPDEWVMFKDETGEIVPHIVSEEIWDKANDILIERSNDVKNRKGKCNHANLLTGKLYCTCCGTPYYRKDSKDKKGNKSSKWVCSGKIKNGTSSCESFSIYEEEMKLILYEIFNESDVDVDFLLKEYIKIYNEILGDNSIESQIVQLNSSIQLIEQKKSKLLEYNVLGKITENDFFSLMEQCNLDLSLKKSTLEKLNDKMNFSNEISTHIKNIESILKNAQKDAKNSIISKEFVDKYIDKILVTPLKDGKMKLDIKIVTSEIIEKYLQPLGFRTGQMSLLMCPIRNKTFKRNNRTLKEHTINISYQYNIVL